MKITHVGRPSSSLSVAIRQTLPGTDFHSKIRYGPLRFFLKYPDFIFYVFNSSFGLPTLVTKICQLIRPWDNLSRRKIYLDIFELREKTLTGVKKCEESPRHVTVSSYRRLTFQIYYNRSNNLIFTVPTSFFLVVAQTF